MAGVITTVACGEPNAIGVGPSFTRVHLAGVEIVESQFPIWSEPRRLSESPLVTIGSEEEGPTQFAFIFQGLFLSDDRLGVADLSTNEFRVFTLDGEHVSTFGGTGEGPGEFRNMALYRHGPDSVVLYDHRLRRATILDPETGEYQAQANPIEGNFQVFGSDGSTGGLLLYNPGAGYRPDLEAGRQWDTTSVFTLRGDAAVEVTRLPSREQVVLADGNTEPLVPAGGSFQVATDGGFYWATTDRYEIKFFDSTGTLTLVIQRPVEPEPVTDEAIAAYVEQQLERVRRTEGEERVPDYRRRYEEGEFGTTVPLFGPAFVDRDGRLWVGGTGWPSGSLDAPWSVFRSDGVWLGDVVPPTGVQLVDASGELVLGIRRDEMDVPSVVVYSLEGSS